MRRWLSLLFCSVVLLACAEPKAPPPAPPPPPAPEPAPPPKCDDLTQGCTVKAGARTKVGTAWTVELPNGWTYAEEATVAVAVAQSAGVALTSSEIKDAKKETETRDEAFKQLTSKLSVAVKSSTAGKNVTWPKKPQRTQNVGALKVSLFQLDAAERAGKKGPLLLFTVKKESMLLVGAGFVADDDSTNADAAILKCIDSLGAP